MQVSHIMSSPALSVAPSTPLDEAMSLMDEEDLRHLPVVVDGKPVGIISARDLFEYVAVGLERFIDQKGYETELAEGEDPFDHLGGSYGL